MDRGGDPRNGAWARDHGVRGADRLDNNIKLIYAVASNALINQHAEHQPDGEDPAGRTARRVHRRSRTTSSRRPRASRTSSCRPARSSKRGASRTDGSTATKCSAAEGRRTARRNEERLPDLGRHRGEARLRAGLHGGPDRARLGGVVRCTRCGRRATRAPPTVAEFEASNAGVHAVPVKAPAVAFADFRRDPVRNPLAARRREESRSSRPRSTPSASRRRSPRSRSTSRNGRARSGPKRSVPAAGRRPSLAGARPLDHGRRGLAGGGLSAAGVHQSGGRRGTRHLERRHGQGLQRPRRDPATVPRDAARSCRASSRFRRARGGRPTDKGLDTRGSINVLTSAGRRWRSATRSTRSWWTSGSCEGWAVVRQFGFFVNSDACSGCKTCQVACKDRHDTCGRRALAARLRGDRPAAGSRKTPRGCRQWPRTTSRCRASTARRRVRPAMLDGRHLEAARRYRAHRREQVHEVQQVRERLPVRRHPLGTPTRTPCASATSARRSRRRPASRLRGGVSQSRARLSGNTTT